MNMDAVVYSASPSLLRKVLSNRNGHLHSSTLLLIIFTVFKVALVSTSELSYTDHCSSFLPISPQTVILNVTASPFPEFHVAFYKSSDNILTLNSSRDAPGLVRRMFFNTYAAHQTDVAGLFMIETSLVFGKAETLEHFFTNNPCKASPVCRPLVSSMVKSPYFCLKGFWSELSGKLCVVGSGSAGDHHGLPAVYKLNYAKNSAIETVLFAGVLESLSSANSINFFKPISLLSFPMFHYEYTLVPEESGNECYDGRDFRESLPASTISKGVCFIDGFTDAYDLVYASGCESTKSCYPFGESIGYLPQTIALAIIHCDGENQKALFLIRFSNADAVGDYNTHDLSKTLVGEGVWDEKKNYLCLSACKILNPTGSLADAYTGDCSIRLMLRIPRFWSIKERSAIVGHLWSTKQVNDLGHFHEIMFRSLESHTHSIRGLRYEYSQVESVKKLCTTTKVIVPNMGERSPTGDYYDMEFDILVKISEGKFARGYAVPLFLGQQAFNQLLVDDQCPEGNLEVDGNISLDNHHNISYSISLSLSPGAKLKGSLSSLNPSLNLEKELEISAEGIYDAGTRAICMVGCRKIERTNSMDCEILVKFQLPSLNFKNGESYDKGSIESMRGKSDPLYFEKLELISPVWSEAQYSF